MIRYEQKYKKKTIICDIDGVCADFVSKFNEEMEKIGYKTIEKKSDEWDLTKRFYPIKGRDIEKDYLTILNNSDFWSNLPVFKDAPEVLEKLNEKYKLLIVTSPFPQVVDAFKAGRFEWLDKYFSFIKRNQIMFESEKWKISADIIIEDKPKTIEKFKGDMKIVMDAPYNKKIDTDYIRVYSWKKIEEILL